ncbi:hypothetical protein BT96DRAFT_209106 [Gymnopus androsaceus JB14]|uniref:Uncharacterized protein n=1 Tax=Gymnopus androsaceus JB14 TaxID=1447944 RepID=A0A6A4I890_9AGAR|nr:hypothetical protein BT96DRAFT_209106 [Gymnopus androsaceus JB14]
MPLTILLHFFSVIMLVKKTLADGFATPLTWNLGTNLTISITDHQSTIEAAIQEVFNNGTSNASDDFFSILAVYDLYNNQTSFKSPVTAYFTNNPFQSNQLNQGVDAMRAYRVYQNSTMLDIATQAWDFGRTLTISDANVVTGSIPSKLFNLTKTCSATLVGGTFWQTTVNDTTIYGISTALFFTLSAYLYQATSDNTYLAAAQDSGAFLIDIMHITG